MNERHHRDWLHYKKEASLTAHLDDRARVSLMREMYLTYLAFQKSKSAEQLAAELRAERRLNAWRLNPRYLQLMEEIGDPQDSR